MSTERQPGRIDRGRPISAEMINVIADQVIGRIVVTGGTSRRIGNSLMIDTTGGRVVNVSQRWISIRITASDAVTASNDTNGNPTQWIYTANEVSLENSGYGGWQTTTNGWTGQAYSFAEDGNDGSGVQMNGIDHDGSDYPSTFDMTPVQIGRVVQALLFTPQDTKVAEAWFDPGGNGEDGTCS